MERYTCNGAYLEKFSNGAFVKYSDHVAEVGKITDQLESLRTTLCSSLAAHSDHAAELARVEAVVSDYAEQIREYQSRAKAAEATHGAPMAWAVFLPKGEEYDYAVFPHVEAAKQHAEILDADEEEGTEPRGVMPLDGDPPKALTLLRAECEAWRKLWAAMKKDSRGSHTQELLKKLAAEAATDAAGILKGAGT